MGSLRQQTLPRDCCGLNKEINAGFTDPKVKARLADMGASLLTGSPADFGRFIASDIAKWAKVIRAGNIKAE
jgi:tripartite-type tricarboxylate transporter receptor subunit TctC